jgi:hypothetical protein
VGGKYHVSSWKGRTTYFLERPPFPANEPGGADQYQAAMRGRWLDEDTFLFELLNYLGCPVKYSIRFVFRGAAVTISTDLVPHARGVADMEGK